MHGRSIALTAALVGMLASAGCAMSPGSQAPASSDAPAGQSLGSLLPGAPEGEVRATGTIMDVAGTVELCLGAVAESYPPQCGGVPVKEWSWEGVDGSEQVDEVRWGSYAVTGLFDGTAFTVTQSPVLLALYDPMPVEDPTGGEPGTTDEARLNEIVDDIGVRLADSRELFLGAYPDNGYVWMDVLWDDGTLQRAADDDFGAEVVVVRSALQPVG
ncbi:hypothetical protein GCM10027408_17400 [Microbacterium tumbae]